MDLPKISLAATSLNPQSTAYAENYISLISLNQNFRLKDIRETARPFKSTEAIAISLSLQSLLLSFRWFTVEDLNILIMAHCIPMTHQTCLHTDVIAALINHTCRDDCRALFYEFAPLLAERDASSVVARLRKCYERVPDASITQAEYFDPFRILTRQEKAKIIQEWQDRMSTDGLQFHVCAVCSENVRESHSILVQSKSMDLSILCNDLLPRELFPTEYNFDAYQGALLAVEGLSTPNEPGAMRICDRCDGPLTHGKMPKFALSNWLYYATTRLPQAVATAFQSASMFEKMMITRARCNNICCRFSTRNGFGYQVESDSTSTDVLLNSRKGIRGNVLVSPLSTLKMNKVIPPNCETIRDTMCAVFIGATLPTTATIRKYSPVLVRKGRVKEMIKFLLASNHHYREVEFSQQNLDILPVEGLPFPVQVSLIEGNDALEVSTSDYTERNIDVDEGNDELLMENVGFTDGDDTPANYQAMKIAALEHCLAGKPFIASGRGSTPVRDFDNPSIMTWLFPHLDPWGIGGFFHPSRVVQISMEDQLKHLLRRHKSPFQSDPEFAFVFFNVIRKAAVSQSLRFSVPMKTHKSIIDKLLSVKADVITKLKETCEKDPKYRPTNDSERDVFRLLSSLGLVATRIPGSDGYKLARRNEIRALINSIGAPAIFITINPSDVDNPIVRLLTGEKIRLEDISKGDDLGEWKRKVLAARNPGSCALFFDLMISNFIDIILRYGRDDIGVFGKCTAYYGMVEAQGKGTLHCHMLIWLEGHPSPQALRDKLAESNEYRHAYIGWLESVVKCEFPLQVEVNSSEYAMRVRARDNNDPHPGVLPAPLIRLEGADSDLFWRKYDEYLKRLLYEYNWHDHQATCWKYLRRGESKGDEKCRMGMDGTTRAKTELEPVTYAINLRRLHPKIASYTELITFLLQCNVNTKYIGSGQAAKAYVYYVTDYITKASVPLHAGIAALQAAIKKGSTNIPLGEQHPDGQQVKAVTSAVNGMMGRLELSHPQVMSYLLGGGDYYTSHKFATVHWYSILHYIKNQTTTAESEDQATVGLTFGRGEIQASNQTLDYIFRPSSDDFELLCLYWFFSRTVKVKKTKGSVTEFGHFSSHEHPQSVSHRMMLRREEVIPVLLGPSVPNPNASEENREAWAMHMLILFKPWRDVKTLKLSSKTWQEEFDDFFQKADEDIQRLIKNMTVLTECKDSREDNQRDTSMDTLNKEFQVPEEDDSSEDEHCLAEKASVDVNASFHAWNEGIDIVDKEVDDHLNRHMGNSVAFLLNQCQKLLPVVARPISLISKHVRAWESDEEQAIEQHLLLMSAKKKRKLNDEKDEASRTVFSNPSRDIVCARTILTAPYAWCLHCDEEQRTAVSEVALEMNLTSNEEQLRAFKIVASRVVQETKNQLLMYVAGVGGTGKSHVIKSISMLFERLGRRHELLICAPTGIAAVLVGGNTMHSLAMMAPNRKVADSTGLAGVWKSITCVIIDEASMIDGGLLYEFSTRIKIGKGHDPSQSHQPFGGIDVIMMGDFGQLKPPIEQPLYSHRVINAPSFAEVEDKKAVNVMNGITLWRQITTVVELIHNQRHSGDIRFGKFLERLRVKKCHQKILGNELAQDDFDYINQRLLSTLYQTGEDLTKFRDAPVIVGNRTIRDSINAKLLAKHAQRLNQDVYVYHSKDVLSRHLAPVKERSRLWDLNSSISKDAFGRLPLFPGMKVMVTENIAFDNGIVNGREGIIRDIVFEEDESGLRYAKVVYIYVPNCGLRFQDLAEDVVPIFPTTTSISLKRKEHQDLGAKSFSRKQLPIVPAYAYTDFKAQGRNLGVAIVDLATARGQGAYVMLSRVLTLSGVAILRPFPPTKIFDRLSGELRGELERISKLDEETKQQWVA